MSWREFEILGAYRDSGEPARLLVEAASEADAADFAASKGVLISRVVDRTDRPRPVQTPKATLQPEPGSQPEAPASAGESIRFAANAIPDLRLLKGERIIASFDASPSEIGLKGILLGDKRRIVLTNHRVIFFQRSLLGATLSSVRLADVSAIRIGASIHALILSFGIASVVLGGLDLVRNLTTTSPLATSLGLADMADSIRSGLMTLDAASIIFGLLMILAARSRIMGVHADGTLHSIRLRSLRGGRSSDFINALARAMEDGPTHDPEPNAGASTSDAGA